MAKSSEDWLRWHLELHSMAKPMESATSVKFDSLEALVCFENSQH